MNEKMPFARRKNMQGFEWKSPQQILGYPLVHVTFGRDPKTGKVLVSQGVIAIGQVGIGLVCFAQAGVGFLFGFGQLMAGWFVIAQGALARTAIAQVGAGEYVLAQIGYGAHVLTQKTADPVAKEYFLKLWEGIEKVISILF